MQAYHMNCPVTFQPYPAAKLDLHLHQIRLISLLPGRYFDKIYCELNTVFLDNLPVYKALSYVWGDRTTLRRIVLNGVSFYITCNLEAALRRLRHPSKIRRFWIDMLCIDQSNMEERTHQVNLMRYIYSEAQETFLWLGDYTEMPLHEICSHFKSTKAQEMNDIDSQSEWQRTSMPGQNPNQDLRQTEAISAISYIRRLSTGQHLDIPLDSTVPPGTVAELRALSKIMNCSW
jgi:hypothetical protein